MKKIFTAAALSTALVLGGGVAAFAVDATPAPTSSATPKAPRTPKDHSAIDAYKHALADFKVANDKYKADKAAHHAALETYKTALDAWRTANAAYLTAKKAIQDTFQAAVGAAKTAYQAAEAAATTDAAKAAAKTALQAALKAAATARDNAVAALPALTSPAPAKPELSKPVQPTKPVRPTPSAK